jgi:hypothetical protein
LGDFLFLSVDGNHRWIETSFYGFYQFLSMVSMFFFFLPVQHRFFAVSMVLFAGGTMSYGPPPGEASEAMASLACWELDVNHYNMFT